MPSGSPRRSAACTCSISSSSSCISFMSDMAASRSSSSLPSKWYRLPRGFRKSISLASRASSASSSGSPKRSASMDCNWARWSGDIDPSSDCAAAIWRRISSSSSSRDAGGSSPNMSPNRSMNSSKPGSSPAIFRTSISFSARSISFIRAMSPSERFFTIRSTSLKNVCVMALRNWFSSSRNLRWASGFRNSYFSRARIRPAASSGSRSSSSWLRSAICRSTSSEKSASSRSSHSSIVASSMARISASFSSMSFMTLPRSKRSRRSFLRSRSWRMRSRRPCRRVPSGSDMPRDIRLRMAQRKSP